MLGNYNHLHTTQPMLVERRGYRKRSNDLFVMKDLQVRFLRRLKLSYSNVIV